MGRGWQTRVALRDERAADAGSCAVSGRRAEHAAGVATAAVTKCGHASQPRAAADARRRARQQHSGGTRRAAPPSGNRGRATRGASSLPTATTASGSTAACSARDTAQERAATPAAQPRPRRSAQHRRVPPKTAGRRLPTAAARDASFRGGQERAPAVRRQPFASQQPRVASCSPLLSARALRIVAAGSASSGADARRRRSALCGARSRRRAP